MPPLILTGVCIGLAVHAHTQPAYSPSGTTPPQAGTSPATVSGCVIGLKGHKPDQAPDPHLALPTKQALEQTFEYDRLSRLSRPAGVGQGPTEVGPIRGPGDALVRDPGFSSLANRRR